MAKIDTKFMKMNAKKTKIGVTIKPKNRRKRRVNNG